MKVKREKVLQLKKVTIATLNGAEMEQLKAGYSGQSCDNPGECMPNLETIGDSSCQQSCYVASIFNYCPA